MDTSAKLRGEMMARVKNGLCKWCGEPILWDASNRMYYRIVDGKARYYCPYDTNGERCQHIPE
jgi:hypothetical protein